MILIICHSDLELLMTTYAKTWESHSFHYQPNFTFPKFGNTEIEYFVILLFILLLLQKTHSCNIVFVLFLNIKKIIIPKIEILQLLWPSERDRKENIDGLFNFTMWKLQPNSAIIKNIVAVKYKLLKTCRLIGIRLSLIIYTSLLDKLWVWCDDILVAWW